MKNDCDFRISFIKNFVLVELEGTLTADCLIDANNALISYSGHIEGKPEIWDIRLLDLSEMDSEAVIKASDYIRELWKEWNIVKVAVISGKSINIGHINLFKEVYQRDIIQMFQTVEQAEAWFNE